MRITDHESADIWFTFSHAEIRELTIPGRDATEPALAMARKHRRTLDRIPNKSICTALINTGGWTQEELDEMDADNLAASLLWVAACDANDRHCCMVSISTY
jgi:hypothetical protein